MIQTVKIQAKLEKDIIEVKSLIHHPMETGLRKDEKSGELVPAHFIQEVICEHNGQLIMTSYWGPSISKNPFFSYKIQGGKVGDKVKLTWKDNRGDTGFAEATLA